MLGGCKIVVFQGCGQSKNSLTSNVTSGKASIFGVESAHFRRKSHSLHILDAKREKNKLGGGVLLGPPVT